MRYAAHERGDDEQQNGKREVVLPAEADGEVRRHRKNHDVRQDVPGRDPSDFLIGRTEVARHLRQRHVDDRGVQHLEDSRSNQPEQDDPALAGDILEIRTMSDRMFFCGPVRHYMRSRGHLLAGPAVSVADKSALARTSQKAGTPNHLTEAKSPRSGAARTAMNPEASDAVLSVEWR